jgi:sigma-B regulation protein RsbU (phosphoserine phosphatase)
MVNSIACSFCSAGSIQGIRHAIRFEYRAVSENAGAWHGSGSFDSAGYTQNERDILPGQILIIGTDGIWEMHNPEGEMFGKDRLRAVIRTYAEASAAEIVHNIMDNLEQVRRPIQKEDDVTLVVIRPR